MQRFNWANSRDGLLDMAKTLDDAGIYSVLLPYGSTGRDYLVDAPAMIDSTNSLKLMIALRPYALTPEYAAKTFKTFNYVYGKRLTLNVVAGILSPEEEKFVFKNYPGDPEVIDNIDKRIEFADNWTKKFLDIMGEMKPEMYTIANSPRTVELGNRYCDAVIFNSGRLEYNSENVFVPSKVLVFDPMIIDSGDSPEPEYLYHSFDIERGKGNIDSKKYIHDITGTTEEVIDWINTISKKYGVTDFLIHTDQKDISKILNLVNIMTSGA